MSDDAEKQVCPLPHPGHPDRASVAAPGAVLCRGHISKLVETLTQLATFDAEADEAAHDQTLSRKAGQPLSGDRERRLPIDLRKTFDNEKVTLADLPMVLASWSQVVVKELKVTAPDLTRVTLALQPCPPSARCGKKRCREVCQDWRQRPETPTARLCAFLAVHHEWSVTRTWADDYAGEILALGRRAWALLHPSGRRQFTNKIMRCVELDEDGTRCPGNMWCFLTPDDPYAEAKGALVCDQCNHEVTSDAWMSYGRKVIAASENAA